ncbi:MAG TPA: hypothetical protein VF678_06085 [bacterium]
MALQVNQSTVAQSNETAARAYNSNVRLSKRAMEDIKRVNPAPAIATAEVAPTGYVPSAYALLLSRIENSAAHGTPERDPIEDLARILAGKMARMSERTKREITALPEFAAADINDLAALPMHVRNRLMNPPAVEALLALLKHPVFASYIKDAQRASLYGPTGMLLAS